MDDDYDAKFIIRIIDRFLLKKRIGLETSGCKRVSNLAKGKII